MSEARFRSYVRRNLNVRGKVSELGSSHLNVRGKVSELERVYTASVQKFWEGGSAKSYLGNYRSIRYGSIERVLKGAFAVKYYLLSSL